MRGDVDDAVVRERRDAHGTERIAGEVEEGRAEREERERIGGDAVAHGSHGVLAHAEPDVPPFGRGGLEVERASEFGQIGRRQVGRAAHELGHRHAQLVEHLLGRLARGEGRVLGCPAREHVAPALRQPPRHAPFELRRELRVRHSVALEKLLPALLLLRARRLAPAIRGRHVLRHVEEGLLGEAVLLLDVGEVGVAEGRAVHTRGALLGRAVPDRRRHLDQRRARELRLGARDRLLESEQVGVAVLYVDRLPAVRLVPLHDVLGEGEVGAAVDLDLIVVVEDDQAAQPQVTRERARLARDALLHAPVAADDVHEVVHHLEALAVEGGGHVGRG